MKHLLIFVGAFLLYLLLAGALGSEQLVSAGVLAVVAVASAALVRSIADRPLTFSPRHVAPWLRATLRLPADAVRIGGALLRVAVAGGSPGRGTVAPFRHGPLDDPRERGRRATAVVAGSLTPDTIVLHIPPGRDAICHRLLANPAPDRPEWLA